MSSRSDAEDPPKRESGGASPWEERLGGLESHFMHLEKLQEQLNEVVIEQQGQIERLTRAVETLQDEVKRGGSASPEGDGGQDAPPPHY